MLMEKIFPSESDDNDEKDVLESNTLLNECDLDFVLDFKLDFINSQMSQSWLDMLKKKRRRVLVEFCVGNVLYFVFTGLFLQYPWHYFHNWSKCYFFIAISSLLFPFLSCLPFLRKSQFCLEILAFFYPATVLCVVGLVNSAITAPERENTMDLLIFGFNCLYFFVFNIFFLIRAEIQFSRVLPFLGLNGVLLVAQIGVSYRKHPIACVVLFLNILATVGSYYTIFRNIMEQFRVQSQNVWLVNQRMRLLKEDPGLQQILDTGSAQQLNLMYGQMAHDIGTPLSALSMGIELMEYEWKQSHGTCGKDNGFDETLEALQASVSIIMILRQAMLDASKQNSRIAQIPTLEPLIISEIVGKQAFLILRQLVAEKSGMVAARWYVEETLSRVEVISARNWILDMLLNLCSNAVKFTDKGFIQISARHVSDRQKDMVRFEVEDSGMGVDPEKVEGLFTKFKQLQVNHGGTGLGLYSIKTKAELLGGFVGYSPRQGGHGSIFFFCIPFVRSELSRPPVTTRSLSRLQTVQGGSARLSATISSADKVKPLKNTGSMKYSKSPAISPSAGAEYSEKALRSPFRRFNTPELSDFTQIGFEKNRNNESNSQTRQLSPSFKAHGSAEQSRPSLPVIMSPVGIMSPKHFHFKDSLVGINPRHRTISSVSNKDSPASCFRQLVEVTSSDSTPSGKAMASLNVIIVEDSAVLRNFYTRLLATLEIFDVSTFETGEQFLETFNSLQNFAAYNNTLILLDDQLPGMRGIDIVPSVADLFEKRGVHQPSIYICSGSHATFFEENFPNQIRQIRGVIQKPLTRAVLKNIIENTKLEASTSDNPSTDSSGLSSKMSELDKINMEISTTSKRSEEMDGERTDRPTRQSLLLNQFVLQQIDTPTFSDLQGASLPSTALNTANSNRNSLVLQTNAEHV